MHLCHVAFNEAAFCCKANVQHLINWGGGVNKKNKKKKYYLASDTEYVTQLSFSRAKLTIYLGNRSCLDSSYHKYRDKGPNYILGLGSCPRTWGDPRMNK